jgi:hypothetical protein
MVVRPLPAAPPRGAAPAPNTWVRAQVGESAGGRRGASGTGRVRRRPRVSRGRGGSRRTIFAMRVEPSSCAGPAPVAGVGAVITPRHVGDVLAIVARVKPIALIVGLESRRDLVDAGGARPRSRRSGGRGPRNPGAGGPPVGGRHRRGGKPNGRAVAARPCARESRDEDERTAAPAEPAAPGVLVATGWRAPAEPEFSPALHGRRARPFIRQSSRLWSPAGPE